MFGSALLLTALEWTAPLGCPQAADVEQMVERMLADADRPTLAARATMVPAADGFEMTVEVGDQRRTLRAQDCTELAGAAALIIAVANDPIAVAAELEASATPGPAPATPSKTQPQPAAMDAPLPQAPPPRSPAPRPETRREGWRQPAPDSTPRPSEHQTFALRPQAGLSLGVLPRPRPAFALGVAWVLGAFRLELAPFGVLPSTTDTQPANARVWLAGGAARVCWTPSLGSQDQPLVAELCGGGELAGLRALGGGAEIRAQGVTQTWAAALGSAGLRLPLSERVSLGLRGGVVVALRKPGVHVDGVGPVFRAGGVGGRVWLGPEFQLP